jgi:hypothetical protein
MRTCAQSSQRSTWPPSAAVRRVSIADMTFSWPGDQGVEQPCRLEEVDEERKLAKRRHRRFVVPLDPDRTKETVEIDPSRRLRRHNQGLFTQWVTRKR